MYATINNSRWNERDWVDGEKSDQRMNSTQTILYEVELTNKFDIHDITWAESKSRINARSAGQSTKPTACAGNNYLARRDMAWTKWMCQTVRWKARRRRRKQNKTFPKLVTGRFAINLCSFAARTVKSRVSGSTFTNYIVCSKRTVEKRAFHFESGLNLKWTEQQQQHQSDRQVETLEPLVRKRSQLPYILFSEQSHST